MADDLPLTGCRAIVVGGARGLGPACCDRLAGSGALVAVLDADGVVASAVAGELRARWRADAVGHAVEAVDWADAARAVAVIVDRWGGIDLLVNQVVAMPEDRGWRAFADEDAESIAACVERSLGAVVSVTRATLDVMIAARRGRIVNVVADTGLGCRPGAVADDASSAAVIGLTRNLSAELSDHGVTAVAVAVGPHAGPDQVADAVAFVASPAASWAHGTVMCDGGSGSV